MEREKGVTKEFGRLVLLFFWQREKRRKDGTLLFSAEFSLAEKKRFGKTKLRKLFGKGRIEGYIQVLFYRSLISFSPFLFESMLNFKALKIS